MTPEPVVGMWRRANGGVVIFGLVVEGHEPEINGGWP
jgi:hypothetical protein